MFNLRKQGDQPKATPKFERKKIDVKFGENSMKSGTFDVSPGEVDPPAGDAGNKTRLADLNSFPAELVKPMEIESFKTSSMILNGTYDTNRINEVPIENLNNDQTLLVNDQHHQKREPICDIEPDQDVEVYNDLLIDGTHKEEIDYSTQINGNLEPENAYSSQGDVNIFQNSPLIGNFYAGNSNGLDSEQFTNPETSLSYFQSYEHDQGLTPTFSLPVDETKFDTNGGQSYETPVMYGQFEDESNDFNYSEPTTQNADPFDMYDESPTQSNNLNKISRQASNNQSANSQTNTKVNFFAKLKETASVKPNVIPTEYNFKFSDNSTSNRDEILNEYVSPPPPPLSIKSTLKDNAQTLASVPLPPLKLMTNFAPPVPKPKFLPKPAPAIIKKVQIDTPTNIQPSTYTNLQNSQIESSNSQIDYEINNSKRSNWCFVGDSLFDFNFSNNTFTQKHSSDFSVLRSSNMFEIPPLEKYSASLFCNIVDEDIKTILDHLVQKSIENPTQLASRRNNFNFILMIVNQILSKQMNEQEFHDLESSLGSQNNSQTDELSSINQTLLEFISNLSTSTLLDNKQSLLIQFKKSFDHNRGHVMKAYFKFCIKTHNYQEVINMFNDVDTAILLLFKIYLQNSHDFESRNFEDIIIFGFENCSKESYKLMWLLLEPQIALKPSGFNFILSKTNDSMHFEVFEFVFWVLKENKILNLSKKEHADLYCFFLLFNVPTIVANGSSSLLASYITLINEQKMNTNVAFTSNPFIQSYMRYYRDLLLLIREKEQEDSKKESNTSKANTKGNLLSFVNKIWTTGKPVNKAPVEEAEEKIVYDPVTKRYFVNGKILTEDNEESAPSTIPEKKRDVVVEEDHLTPPPPPPLNFGVRPPMKMARPQIFGRTISEIPASNTELSPPLPSNTFSKNISTRKESDHDSESNTLDDGSENRSLKPPTQVVMPNSQLLKRKNQLAKNRFVAFPQK